MKISVDMSLAIGNNKNMDIIYSKGFTISSMMYTIVIGDSFFQVISPDYKLVR